MFFKDKEIHPILTKCFNSITEQSKSTLNDCEDVCRRFNPVRYDHFFEG